MDVLTSGIPLGINIEKLKLPKLRGNVLKVDYYIHKKIRMIDLQNLWILTKYRLGLPFPIRNHFYKGRRIDVFKALYCTCCNRFFAVDKEHRKVEMRELCCPRCRTQHYIGSVELFKAMVDRKPLSDVLCMVDRNSKFIAMLDEKEE